MLLILLAIQLLYKDGSATPLQQPPNARATTDSCDDINSCRTLFSIVRGCLATIFACTWVSVHPNVPPPGQSRLQLFWRRLKMMLIGIIAPEIMVGFAARQFFVSRKLSKECKSSTTHGFFVCMGGFVSPTGHPIATLEQLRDRALGSKFQEAIRNVNEEDIMDKSKGDALSKSVALLQGLWFTVQCLARAHQRLAITQFEVATLAFAIVNIFIWLLWWDKPLNVERPIVVGPPTAPDTQARAAVQWPISLQFEGLLWELPAYEYHPLSSVAVPSFWSSNDDIVGEDMLLLTLVGALFGAIHCAAWNAGFPTPVEMWIWRTSSLVITAMPGLAWLVFAMIVAGRFDTVATVSGEFVIKASPLYIAGRAILVVLPLIGLRSLPPSAFVDVNWSNYILHI
ncbi:hypothetical protein C8R45DRAFT_1084219 [Mycena sanguinolenta]|nr:hypothetical protein C8R45DRAFT_1084219 [Mycena sanguinolenta]